MQPEEQINLRELLLIFRTALLLAVDGIERMVDIHPRTAELKKNYKRIVTK